MSAGYDVVIPTLGRPSLHALLERLTAFGSARVVVVDDRPGAPPPLLLPYPGVEVVRSGGGGPAAARNIGWRRCHAPWIVFLDDDVLPSEDWPAVLERDLAEPSIGATAARIVVPLPEDRRPTDWERNVAGLQRAVWITADIAYRREVLERLGGLDERFQRAYREDTDLGLRATRAGYRIVQGSRVTLHPVRPVDPFVSVRLQAGNADDVLMRKLHGPDWRRDAHVPRGRRRAHIAVTAAAVATLVPQLRKVALAAWLLGTAEFAWARITPGPRTAAEIAAMLATSALIPPVATYHYLRGRILHRHQR